MDAIQTRKRRCTSSTRYSCVTQDNPDIALQDQAGTAELGVIPWAEMSPSTYSTDPALLGLSPADLTPRFPVSEEVNHRIALHAGDITVLQIDSLVLAAGGQTSLGLAGTIHRAAGPGLKAAYDFCGPADLDHPVVTGGFHLQARHALHAKLPECRPERQQLWWEELRLCYRKLLDAAAGHGFQSVAFPCFWTAYSNSTKITGARAALGTVREWLQMHDCGPELVVFVLPANSSENEIYKALLPCYFPRDLMHTQIQEVTPPVNEVQRHSPPRVNSPAGMRQTCPRLARLLQAGPSICSAVSSPWIRMLPLCCGRLASDGQVRAYQACSSEEHSEAEVPGSRLDFPEPRVINQRVAGCAEIPALYMDVAAEVKSSQPRVFPWAEIPVPAPASCKSTTSAATPTLADLRPSDLERRFPESRMINERIACYSDDISTLSTDAVAMVPSWCSGQELEQSYREALDVAASMGFRSVALPSPLCEGDERDKIEAAHTALRTVRLWLKAVAAIDLVVFVTQTGTLEKVIYERLLPCYFPQRMDYARAKNEELRVIDLTRD